ncbi:surface-adhesin E family protein [Brevundimonas naejangsanensis]|uniref:surface-adhesin E family protein n=1 Tax=Brevundimonas naejangsanensis TaxID=588932 RepID=UPI0034D41676
MSLVAGAAHAGDWRVVGASDNAITLIDASSLRSGTYSTSAWVGFIYGSDRTNTDPDPDIDFAVVRTEFICSSGTMRMAYLYNYRADGSLVRSSEMTEGFKVPPPDSLGNSVVLAACDGEFSSDTIASTLSEMFNEESKAAARARRGRN